MEKKFKVLLIAVIATLMLFVAKSNAQDFKMGSFRGHVSVMMDASIDHILEDTKFIQWYGEKKVLKNLYGFEYDYKSSNNPYQFEFLSNQEYKKFSKNNGPITIEFLNQKDELIYKVQVYSHLEKHKYIGGLIPDYQFVYGSDQLNDDQLQVSSR